MTEKEYKCLLVLDWKTGKFKVLTTKRTPKFKTSEIPIQLSLKVEAPEIPLMKAEGTIKLSQAQISQMIIEEIKDNG